MLPLRYPNESLNVSNGDTDMPAGDRTGATGIGAMTGRGAGYCGGSPVPGFENPGPGRGRGRGFGRGRGGGRRGWRHQFQATGVPFAERMAEPEVQSAAPSAEPLQQAEIVNPRVEHLEQEIEELGRRIAELEDTQRKED